MNELPSHSQSTTVISTGQSVWWDVLPDQCTVQQQGQQWSCPQFHRYDETPSHPSLPAVTSCKPGSTPSPIRSDSLSAAGSCRPSYRWPPVLSLDWSPSDRHCDTTITAEHVSSEKNTTQMFLQVINISYQQKNKRFINKLRYQCATAVLGNSQYLYYISPFLFVDLSLLIIAAGTACGTVIGWQGAHYRGWRSAVYAVLGWPAADQHGMQHHRGNSAFFKSRA